MEINHQQKFFESFWREIEPYLFRADLEKWEFTTFNADDSELMALCQKLKKQYS